MAEIILTKGQYLELLKAVDAAAMMQEALNEYDGKDLKQEEYRLRDYLLTFAPQFDLSPVDFTIPKRDWTDDLFEESFRLIDDHAEMEMWEKLAFELAALEVDRIYGGGLEGDQRVMKIWETQEKYLDEFSENGLENVTIKGINNLPF